MYGIKCNSCGHYKAVSWEYVSRIRKKYGKKGDSSRHVLSWFQKHWYCRECNSKNVILVKIDHDEIVEEIKYGWQHQRKRKQLESTQVAKINRKIGFCHICGSKIHRDRLRRIPLTPVCGSCSHLI